MEIVQTAISDVVKLVPRRFADQRGFFTETWNAARMRDAGLDFAFVQDNHSFSSDRGTVRGLHYQAPPMAQSKLVRAARGAVLDVAVDVRAGSPTYGQWVAEELNADKGEQLLVPRGFLHGFITLTNDVDVIYKVDSHYSPEHDGAVRFDDPDLGIDWGTLSDQAILSDKDAAAPAFADWTSPFTYEAA